MRRNYLKLGFFIIFIVNLNQKMILVDLLKIIFFFIKNFSKNEKKIK
jgi:hypothetical protein